MSMSTPHHGERAVVVSMVDMTTGGTPVVMSIIDTTTARSPWWGGGGETYIYVYLCLPHHGELPVVVIILGEVRF